MLDIAKVLKRAWHILWNYRILWVFGFILALAGGGIYSRGGANAGSGSGWQTNSRELQQAWPQLHLQDLNQEWNHLWQTQGQLLTMLIWVGVVALAVILITATLVAIARYVSETAVIRMVNEYEQTGAKVGFRQGLKYGWSRTSWRLFLINLLLNLPVLFLLILLGLIVWWNYLTITGGSESAIIASLIAGVGLAFLFIFLTVIVEVVLMVLRDFAWRVCVLEGTGVIDSLRQGTAFVRRNWQSVGLMWLVMLGLGIAWAIAAFLLMFPLIVVCFFTALAGLIVAAIPGLVVGGIASLFATGVWPWIFAAIVALPLFFTITFSPLFLVGGWAAVFRSNAWTLTYRELKALNTITVDETPAQAK